MTQATRRERALKLAQRGLLIGGAFLLSWAALTTWQAQAANERRLALLDEEIAVHAADREPRNRADDDARSPTRPVLPLDSGLVGRIDVARLGITAAIMHGIDRGTLQDAVGHVPGTAFPGEPGNVGLAAHRDGFFAELRHVRIGDRIDVATPFGSYAYRVTATHVVEPEDVWVLDEAEGRDLTLITCHPFNFFGPAPQRLVVHAAAAPR